MDNITYTNFNFQFVRYSSKRFPTTCSHKGKSLLCKQLNCQDIQRIYQAYLKENSLLKQNSFILLCIQVSTPKCSTENSKTKFSTEYTLSKRKEGITKNISVCWETFRSILQVGRDRLQCLCLKILKSPVTPPKKRGGDHISETFSERKERVKSHIGKVIPLEAHYSRATNCESQYLSSHPTTAKMHEMFNKVYLQLRFNMSTIEEFSVTTLILFSVSPVSMPAQHVLVFRQELRLQQLKKMRQI